MWIEKKYIAEGLNVAQKQAVEQYEGPSLIIAGAGSGKTRVLTYRVANILNHGYKASSILALTFTNKAAKEMKERIATLVGEQSARSLWMGTFHSIFVRFLKENAHLLDFPSDFTIYDSSDSKNAIKACIKDLGLDEKLYKPSTVLARISMAKNNLITSSAYLGSPDIVERDTASRVPRIGEIYALYAKRCKISGAMDFDDLLLYTNILFRDSPQVLERLQNRFNFILVDEYQDTNYSQYLIVKKLSAKHRNLCVVGDDSQSIYAFRGARIENILNFRKDYPDAKEFRLEQNYRSTQVIVEAANSLIAKNSAQIKKECFSQVEGGDKIEIVKAYTDSEEAFLVASSILSKYSSSKLPYSGFAVLYRTNAQSRAIEEALRKRAIPYRIYGGHSFYDRAEVKDIIAYMRLLVNPRDDEALRRVVNVPSRGIGATSISRVSQAAMEHGISLWEAITHYLEGNKDAPDLAQFGLKGAAIERLALFCKMIAEVRSKVGTVDAYDVAKEIFAVSGYSQMLTSDNSIEGLTKRENVDELFASIKSFVEEGEAELQMELEEKRELEKRGERGEKIELEGEFKTSVLLNDFLETISLMSAVDDNAGEESGDRVNLMTVHSAKGLEFNHVYIMGVEESLFPSITISSDESQIEEERRLMYVALTRAKESVTISYAQTRFRWGNYVNYLPSRFIAEIDDKFLNLPESTHSRAQKSVEPSRVSSPARLPFNSRAPLKPADPNFKPDPVSKLREGQRIEHDRFGYGDILSIEGDPLNLKAIVVFDKGGRKTLLLKFAKLRAVD